VTGKHRNYSAVNKVINEVPVAFMFGARNTTMLPVIAKKVKHVFMCHALVLKKHLRISKKSLEEQLKTYSLT
jgi:hypothetical protein